MRKKQITCKVYSILQESFTTDSMRIRVPSKLPVGQKATIACITDRVNMRLVETNKLGYVKHIMSHARVYYTANKLVMLGLCDDIQTALQAIKYALEKRKYVL